MRYKHSNERRAVILMVVLALLTLFAIVGISFVLYADAEAASARVARESETQQRADVPPEQALAFFLSQFIYDVPDNTGFGSGLRGHSLARTMYGYNPGSTNINPFNGVGRFHFQESLSMYDPIAQQQTPITIDDYTMVNYTWFSQDTFGLRDPERFGTRGNLAAQQGAYIGGNAPYTYPDLNNFFLAAVTANGTVLTPSFHRKWLFNPNTTFNDMNPKNNPNWTNPQGKYLTLRPRPVDHQGFPPPDDATGDVKNLIWAPGGNDSIWIDIGAPVMTAPDGTLYKMLVAPLIMDLDNRINLNTAGNVLAFATAMNTGTPPSTWQQASAAHTSNQGWSPSEVNVSKVLYADMGTWNASPAGVQSTPPEWMRLITGMTPVTPANNQSPTFLAGVWANNPPNSPPTGVNALLSPTMTGRYIQTPLPSMGTQPGWTPTASTNPATQYMAFGANGTYPHAYAPIDFNGLNESSNTPPYTTSSQPTAPTGSTLFAQFANGYLNGNATENGNHPLLFTVNQQTGGTRLFNAADMELLLRPSSFANGNPVDANAAGIFSSLTRLAPLNLSPWSSSMRSRNMVTTLSADLGVPGVTPYWWANMPSGYLAANTNDSRQAPTGTALTFPSLPPNVNVSNSPGTTPISSEFSTEWRALSADTLTYMPYLSSSTPLSPPGYTSPTFTWGGTQWTLGNYTLNATGYTTPGARIRLNRPLPPYPHMGSGVVAPYATAVSNYGTAYDLTQASIANQYQAALNARQALANDIYRRLLALSGIATPQNPGTPTTADLVPRRWLAQLAVNIVDYLDEDDISTPFNFYTTADGLTNNTSVGNTQGPEDPGNPNPTTNNASGTNATGANPTYWVFGTEMPKVVLNEVLAEAQNPSGQAPPAGVTIPGNADNVNLWIELFNTMSSTTGTTQVQDSYRVPLWMSNTPAGAKAGYSPYRITISQYLMNAPDNPNPPTGLADVLNSDRTANVLGKAYVANPPFPQSTTDMDFSPSNPDLANGVPFTDNFTTPPPATPLYQTASTPAAGITINAGVDAGNYFLIGPKPANFPKNPNAANTAPAYQDPFAAPNLPTGKNIPVLQTTSMSYNTTWDPNVAADITKVTDERNTGLTVMLRRLANPYLPYNGNPVDAKGNIDPTYNPYITVDYISNVPIQSNYGLLQSPQVKPAPYSSRGKTQPFASLTKLTAANQANPGSSTTNDSPVFNQTANAAPPPTGAQNTNNVLTTFGYTNYPLPPSGNYSWLVHLDRPPISPMELLHVSAWPPYMLTQQFMLGSDNLSNNANTTNAPNAANAGNMFGHYAPWLDGMPTGQKSATMAGPWWFDANLTTGSQSHRLYRLFEFLECGDRMTGINGLGRIPGKVNINTIWDPEILQAILDANSSVGMTALAPSYPPNASDPITQMFVNMMQSRSPNASYNVGTGTHTGTIGAVNMGTGSDDHPFLPLSAGLVSTPSSTTTPPLPQYMNGQSVATDTLLRLNPNNQTQLLFQNPGLPNANPAVAGDSSSIHPYMQTQLLNKLYNNVTTRSNTFAVFLTVGFFQVMNPAASPPTLGPEIGRSEGRQVRHRMFAIVDRSNLALATTSGSQMNNATPPTVIPITGPTLATNPPNPTGQATITLPLNVVGGTNAANQQYLAVPNTNTGIAAMVVAGTQLVIDAGTVNEETVVVTSVVPAPNPQPNPKNPILSTLTANFAKPHPTGTVQITIRGNPGPWTQAPYDYRRDTGVVLYYNIMD